MRSKFNPAHTLKHQTEQLESPKTRSLQFQYNSHNQHNLHNQHNSHNQHNLHNQRGMSLVELMVSLTLTTLIIGLVSLMMSQSDRQFRFVSQQENIERQVRAVQGTLTDLLRREAIAEVIPTPTSATGIAQTPDPNTPFPLFQWKNATGGEGKIQLLGSYLQWSYSTQVTPDPAVPGATPFVMNSTRTIAEQLHRVVPNFDQQTQQLNLQLEWKMSDGQIITHQWAYTLQRWDQPLIPTPSEEPSPSPTP